MAKAASGQSGVIRSIKAEKTAGLERIDRSQARSKG
jgi:hypothetical protein